MQKKIFELKPSGYHWVDLSQPTEDDVENLAEHYGLHPTSVEDCLEPKHLPKFEHVSGLNFLILRAYDERCSSDADTVQELTRKMAVFAGKNFVLTVHRSDQPFIADLRQKWGQLLSTSEPKPTQLLAEILESAVMTYEAPLETTLIALEDLESRIFRGDDSRQIIQDGFYFKRRLSIFRRILRLTLDVVRKLHSESETQSPLLQDVREHAERLLFSAEELHDNVQSLLRLHLSLESQRTNEASLQTNSVVRLLTVVSVFFMPISFITSLYGMNFDLSEFHWKHGYAFVWGAMGLSTVGTYIWMKKRGWL